MKQDAIAETLKTLMAKREMSVPDLSMRTGIPRSTLYSMLKKQTNQADLEYLKKLADEFGEDISIFCGIEEYQPPIKLSEEERILLTIFRKLNSNGRERFSQYARELGDNTKMLKRE